jgi:hypothetical protein
VRNRKNQSSSTAGELIRKLRKPLAPPIKVEEDKRKYNRARERQQQRRG